MPTNVVWFTAPSPKAPNLVRRHNPAPPFRGASRNRFLSCQTMSVYEKQNNEKRLQIKELYGRPLLPPKEVKRKPQVTFVTKVQIKSKKISKIEEEVEAESGKESEVCVSEENGQYITQEKENVEDSKISDSASSRADQRNEKCAESERKFFPLTASTNSSQKSDKIDLLWSEDSCLTEFDERKEIKDLVRVLSLRVRGTTEPETQRFKTLTAAFARPTRGELFLNEKGPVPLVPVMTGKFPNRHKKQGPEIRNMNYYRNYTERRFRSWSLPVNASKLGETLDVNFPQVTGRPSSLPSRYGFVITNSDSSSNTSSEGSTSSTEMNVTKYREGRSNVREFLQQQNKLRQIEHTLKGPGNIAPRCQSCVVKIPGRTLELELEKLEAKYESPLPPSPSPTGF